MAKILIIKGYLTNDADSNSKQVGDKFLSYYKAKNPNDEFTTLDLNNEEMAHITLSRNNMSTYWSEEHSDKYINQLKEVDKVIMMTPMINFSPSPLIRNYFDHIMVANKTFTYKYVAKGKSRGLLDHLKVELIISQGSPQSWYTFTKLDEFVAGAWEFIGAKINGTIMIDGTKTEEYREAGGINTFINKIDSKIKKDSESF